MKVYRTRERIKTLLGRNPLDLPGALRVQRRVLAEKRRLLDRAIHAISEAERAPDSTLLKRIIEVIEMQNDSDRMMKYYNEEAKVKIQARGRRWTPELQARAEKDWSDLFRDVEAAG